MSTNGAVTSDIVEDTDFEIGADMGKAKQVKKIGDQVILENMSEKTDEEKKERKRKYMQDRRAKKSKEQKIIENTI